MHDRKMVKWMPFNSVINGSYLVKAIEKEKSKTSKPVLSDEQIENFEKIIMEGMHNKITLSFLIYKGGFVKEITGLVINIEPVKQKIFLDNNRYIYFCEIVDAHFLL